MNMNLYKLFIKVFVLVLFSIPTGAFAIDTVATGFRVDGITPYEIDAWSACRVVISENSNTYFVPTKTSSEWSSFRSVHEPNGTDLKVYNCSLPASQCRVKYQYKIDKGSAAEKYTPYTNNTTTYQTGPYSVYKTGKDDHCNSSPGCGIRSGVQCQAGGDYAIRVQYEMQFEGISGGAYWTPWSNSSTAYGSWSDRIYETGDSECSSPSGCKIRMQIEDNHPEVTCSIGYQHRDQNSVSGWAYDWNWATIYSQGSEGENCEGAGCGFQVRVYCEGPPEGIVPSSGSSGSSGSGVPGGTIGQCGSANGVTYASPFSPINPTDNRCSVGTVSGYTHNTTVGIWTWDCVGTWTTESCFAFDGNIDWGDFGETGCFVKDTQVVMHDGTKKNIQDVVVGDRLADGVGGVNTVQELFHIPYKGNIHSFNDQDEAFFTTTHPFFTTEGWKSLDPAQSMVESPELEVSLLEVGDTIIMQDGSFVTIKKINTEFTKEWVYNFRLDGSKQYVADGYIVHNTELKP